MNTLKQKSDPLTNYIMERLLAMTPHFRDEDRERIVPSAFSSKSLSQLLAEDAAERAEHLQRLSAFTTEMSLQMDQPTNAPSKGQQRSTTPMKCSRGGRRTKLIPSIYAPFDGTTPPFEPQTSHWIDCAQVNGNMSAGATRILNSPDSQHAIETLFYIVQVFLFATSSLERVIPELIGRLARRFSRVKKALESTKLSPIHFSVFASEVVVAAFRGEFNEESTRGLLSSIDFRFAVHRIIGTLFSGTSGFDVNSCNRSITSIFTPSKVSPITGQMNEFSKDLSINEPELSVATIRFQSILSGSTSTASTPMATTSHFPSLLSR